MNDFDDTPSILAVGAKLANLARAKATGDVGQPNVSLAEADSATNAFDLLRVLRFDLVAVGLGLSDMSTDEFAQRLRQAKPWQKWAMVVDDAGRLTQDEEVVARSLGAVAILDGPDAWRDVVEVACLLRRRQPETTVPGLSLGTTASASA